ncbi:hypothetical protein [Streptomyces sp. NPDC048312]|uniref:hypothetical protein n=1 Tax=unclassified Streptomyces TaxID=2593676 RepID=UPI0033F692B3
MEIAGALLSIIVVLAPSLKGWVDSVSYRNRVQARASLVRARRGQDGDGSTQRFGKRGQTRG